MQAAARIALDEGLSATTVRRVACEARTAVGQVHHHFSSAASLRAKAYALVMRELQWDLEATSCHLPALERLQLYLIDAKHERYMQAIRLWREAMLLSEQDDLMKDAFAGSLYDWHRLVTNVIDSGLQSGAVQGDG
ncbi:AcrR family transcriptional regulator [Ewingella americana]